MADEKSERLIRDFTARVQALLGQDIISILLYGSAAGDDFNRKRSDINVMIVVGELAPNHLEKMAKEISSWRRKGISTPLLVDRQYIEDSADVFPIEFSEIASRYRVLTGSDLFAGFRIDPRNLRYQCEHEARGKLLRLRQIYLDVGNSKRELRTLMTDSVKTFIIIMRAFLRLSGEQPSPSSEETIARVEAQAGIDLPTMEHVLAVRAGREQWRPGTPQETFFAYHDELRRFVGVIDRFLANQPEA